MPLRMMLMSPMHHHHAMLPGGCLRVLSGLLRLWYQLTEWREIIFTAAREYQSTGILAGLFIRPTFLEVSVVDTGKYVLFIFCSWAITLTDLKWIGLMFAICVLLFEDNFIVQVINKLYLFSLLLWKYHRLAYRLSLLSGMLLPTCEVSSIMTR
jgi:hypothetical protein